jgi:hypothetical protein
MISIFRSHYLVVIVVGSTLIMNNLHALIIHLVGTLTLHDSLNAIWW